MSDPTEASVLEAMNEFRAVGEDAFLARYTSGGRPKSHFLEHEGVVYPLKALWAAVRRPPIHAREFITFEARRRLEKLGFAGALQR